MIDSRTIRGDSLLQLKVYFGQMWREIFFLAKAQRVQSKNDDTVRQDH